MKYSKVQYDLWRVRARLSRQLAKMMPEQVQRYFDGVDKRVEAKLGMPLGLRSIPATMRGEGQAMRTLKLYIETSVWSHWFADDSPERRDATRRFFDLCRRPEAQVDLYTSGFVADELGDAPGNLAGDLAGLVDEFEAIVIRPTPDVYRLAEAYVTHGAIPEAKRADRLHAALATVREMDMLVSWNYRHLVNVSRRERINQVNAMEGYYKPLQIVTPPEVLEDEVQQETD
jgi:hypothetical protein